MGRNASRRGVLHWPDESDAARQQRRDQLTHLDGLLLHIEQHNLQAPGAPVPRFLLGWYRRCGGARFSPLDEVSGAELHEAVLNLQEALVRRSRNEKPASPFV